MSTEAWNCGNAVGVREDDRPSLGQEVGRVVPRGPRFPRALQLLALAVVIVGGMSAQAIIFFSTGDPNFNTEAPAGELSGSGWDLQGSWSLFLGTPISPKHFITAKHLGGVVGDKFLLNSVEYTTTAFFDDPNSDLRIWRIRETFARHAELYPRTDEVERNLVVFGRGTQRGDEVAIDKLLGRETKGWMWGPADGRKRWGENRVSEVLSDGRYPGVQGGLLRAAFNADAGPKEAHLSAGDSGGAVFVHDGAAWKLAGISVTVDGPYNTGETGSGFYATIFDEGGLYKGGEGNWSRVADSPSDVPGGFYATRVSVRLDWINGILAQSSAPEPPSLESAPSVNGPYTRESGAVVNHESQVITVTRSTERRFYRLNSSTPLRLIEIEVQSGSLVLRYE